MPRTKGPWAMNARVRFRGESCGLKWGKYGNGRTALQLICANGEPMATASVNLVDGNVAEGEMAVKDYSENEGMLNALLGAGIVSEPIRYVRSGFVTVPICRLLPAPSPLPQGADHA